MSYKGLQESSESFSRLKGIKAKTSKSRQYRKKVRRAFPIWRELKQNAFSLHDSETINLKVKHQWNPFCDYLYALIVTEELKPIYAEIAAIKNGVTTLKVDIVKLDG